MRLPLAFAALALLAAGCGRLPWEPEPEEPEPPRLVVVEPVEVDEAVDLLTVLGDVHGRREVRVMSQVPERIRVLHVQEGDTVAAGDPLVTLDGQLQSTGVDQARAALLAAEVSRDQLRADAARAERLVNEGAMARSQLLSLDAQLRAAEAQVQQLRAARRSAGQQAARTVVRAPIAGTVALLQVEEGDMAGTVPLCTILQLDPLDVHLRLTEQDYVRVRVGMPAVIRPPSLPDVERAGTVRRRSPVLDPLTRTAQVEVEVRDPSGTLRPGMVAEVAIELGRRSGVVLAPARAVLLGNRTDRDRSASLFVVQDGVATRRQVTLGRRYDRRIEIAEGLTGGEQVVVQGQHLLRDGAEVRLAERGGDAVARAEGP